MQGNLIGDFITHCGHMSLGPNETLKILNAHDWGPDPVLPREVRIFKAFFKDPQKTLKILNAHKWGKELWISPQVLKGLKKEGLTFEDALNQFLDALKAHKDDLTNKNKLKECQRLYGLIGGRSLWTQLSSFQSYRRRKLKRKPRK
jgi:hypothetical protein